MKWAKPLSCSREPTKSVKLQPYDTNQSHLSAHHKIFAKVHHEIFTKVYHNSSEKVSPIQFRKGLTNIVPKRSHQYSFSQVKTSIRRGLPKKICIGPPGTAPYGSNQLPAEVYYQVPQRVLYRVPSRPVLLGTVVVLL